MITETCPQEDEILSGCFFKLNEAPYETSIASEIWQVTKIQNMADFSEIPLKKLSSPKNKGGSKLHPHQFMEIRTNL